jgi:hypothetical protein
MNNKVCYYDKLWIGTLSVALEQTIGLGYILENIKISKQVTGDSYYEVTRRILSPNFFSSYKGYLKYGLPQSLKGFPILFTQYACHKVMEHSNIDFSNQFMNITSGAIGGCSQAIFITPFQRCRSILLTSNDSNPFRTISQAINNDGTITLIKGITPTIMKRSSDWALRFYTKGLSEGYMKQLNGGRDLNVLEKLVCGFSAGLTSIVTIPFDSAIAMTQQHKNISSYQILKHNYQTYGFQVFTRGLIIRLMHSSWHTMFVLGIGDIIFSLLQK